MRRASLLAARGLRRRIAAVDLGRSAHGRGQQCLGHDGRCVRRGVRPRRAARAQQVARVVGGVGARCLDAYKEVGRGAQRDEGKQLEDGARGVGPAAPGAAPGLGGCGPPLRRRHLGRVRALGACCALQLDHVLPQSEEDRDQSTYASTRDI